MSSTYSNIVPYKGQVYSRIKNNLLQTGTKFRDPEFPPTNQSLFHSKKNNGIEWKRAQEINPNASLFVDGISSRDIIQGDLGNCWLVAAFCTLAVHKNNWTKVIPDYKEQDFATNHPGIFHFRFWRFGSWIDVVVDDYLPVRKGKLIFCHAPSKNEFWPALVEKAYAKLYGSYESLNGGELAEALEDFTGGVTESFDILEEKLRTMSERRQEFFEYVKGLMSSDALVCAAIPALNEYEMEKSTPMGLVMGHAYAMTGLREVRVKRFGLGYQDPLPMVRMRNPWGGIEWKGAFSDKSPEWNNISEYDRKNMGLVFADDGEFWMTYDNFIDNFKSVSICHNVNTSVVSMLKKWNEAAFHSEWRMPDRCGGCINNKKTFLNNPQFMFEIPDEGDEAMMHLVQKSTVEPGQDRFTIGFTIMKVEDNRKFRTNSIQKIVTSSIYRNSRSIFLRYFFPRGRYILIPTTFEPGLLEGFLLRMYNGVNSNARELDILVPNSGLLDFLPWNVHPKMVTQVKVMSANGLSKRKEMNPFCVIKCGKKSIKTPTMPKTSSPTFDTTAIFYRKNATKDPIYVEVWNKGFAFNELIGRQMYVAAEEMRNKVLELPLFVNENGVEVPNGRISVAFTTSHDIHKV